MASDDDKPARRFVPGTRFKLTRPSATRSAADEPYAHPHNHPHVHDEAGHGHAHSHDGSHSHSHDNAAPGAASPTAKPRAPAPPIERDATRGRLALHFDCFSGLAGDMIVAALIDLGVPLEPIRAALEALPVEGYSADLAEVEVSSIGATRFVVDVQRRQPFRTWKQIRAMLEGAPALDDRVRARALATFEALAVAEAKIHHVTPEEVHFHEVGAVDAIVDIVSASAALAWLDADVSCAPLPMGRGFIRSEHGIIPLPAPAVLELLAGIPTIDAGINGELVTPTGAAIIRANAKRFVSWPSFAPMRTGFGAGTRKLPDRPNVLRVVLGTATPPTEAKPTAHTHCVLESNLDDAAGEVLAHATAALLREGALDAWTESIGMKKSRPAVKLCALVRREDRERLSAVLLREAPTLGVRAIECSRVERPRRTVLLDTPWGPLPCKVSDGDGLPPSAKPEDDAVAALAAKAGVPARVVRDAAMAALVRALSEGARQTIDS
ncbi:MAG: nickel pincer cofactor biosynthesis protein LarC [Myxococcales bacterium]|nr:nickel pincer cofactor biosynthesis protein LarC [Myxococcales bacterium]